MIRIRTLYYETIKNLKVVWESVLLLQYYLQFRIIIQYYLFLLLSKFKSLKYGLDIVTVSDVEEEMIWFYNSNNYSLIT